MGDLTQQREVNPGAIGANLSTFYTNLSNEVCIVHEDGVERAMPNMTANGPLNPRSNGVNSLGSGNLGYKELFLDYTNSVTQGPVTINKASGRCNANIGATSLVVTNNLVTANSHVMAWPSANDITGRVTAVVPAAGNFTIYLTAPTANMAIDFAVFGAD